MISFQNMKEDTTPKPLKTREWLPYHVPVLKIFHSSLQLFRHNLLKELYSSIALGIKEMSEQYIYHISDPKLLNVLLLLLLQSYPTLCDPIDGSPPSSPVPGILQARTLEWVAISFSNAWKWKVKVKLLSRVRLGHVQFKSQSRIWEFIHISGLPTLTLLFRIFTSISSHSICKLLLRIIRPLSLWF